MTLVSATEAIESERLILRRLNLTDLGNFADFHANAAVARYIGTGKPRSKAETETWLLAILQTYEESNLGQLAVVRKLDGVVLGRCGLSDAAVERENLPGMVPKGWFFASQAPRDLDVERVPELGYTFGQQYWGKGYASEAVRCVFDYIRAARELPKIMSVIHPDNRASLGVAQKFGVVLVDQIEMSGQIFDRYDWPMS